MISFQYPYWSGVFAGTGEGIAIAALIYDLPLMPLLPWACGLMFIGLVVVPVLALVLSKGE